MQTRSVKRRGVAVAVLVGVIVGGIGNGGRAGPSGGSDEKLTHPPVRSDPRMLAEEKVLRTNAAAYTKAFNAGNAKALAAFWTPDGDYVDTTGQLVRGRAAIEKDLAALFAERGQLTIVISPESFRFLGPDVAIETGRARVTRAADGSATTSRYTVVHVKQEGQWRMSSVRESPHEPATHYEHLRELEWLVGKWEAKGNQAALEETIAWTDNKNYLRRTYSVKSADGSTNTGMQVIAWDPLTRQIRSWTFDSDGTFRSEWWTKQGNRWVLTQTGVLPDGSPTQCTNVLQRVNDDTFTWRSAQRSLGGTRLPDLAEIKVTRTKAKK
jgi:uncharacterized protein (TIGR02246 family)